MSDQGQRRMPPPPVRPAGMAIYFLYPCPYCQHDAEVRAPVTPSVTRCTACGRDFLLAPVDGRTMNYLSLMLEQGRAAIDPDFL